MVLAFLLGRFSVDAQRAPEKAPAKDQMRDAAPLPCAPKACLSTPATTSTVALCPCPKPKLVKALPIKRKPRSLLSTGPAAERDPTEKTAKYLREHARDLSSCAPRAGGELRIHLEVTVTPEGAIDRIDLTNLEPPPREVAECVRKRVEALTPPGFDASDPETFALTVVL